jgi:hypothetical protein
MHQAPDTVIEAARQTLAAELACSPTLISVYDVADVEWNDSSLGCPKPGMMYMQVITPGYRIVLEYDGNTYTFHADRNSRVVRCETDR